MNDCRPTGTALEENCELSKNDCPQEGREEQLRMSKTNFRNLIGCLNYSSLSSRPDICFAAIALSSCVENSGEVHWKAAKRVFWYLRVTMNQTLTLRKTQVLDLLNFSDTDLAGNIDNSRSTSGFCFKLSESSGEISWGCKAQRTVAISTAEAEINSVVEASKEAIHLSGILEDLGISCIVPLQIFVDNQACIALSKHSMHHWKTKHFAIKLHFVRKLVENQKLELSFLTTEKMPADILTKSRGIRKHSHFRTYLAET